MCYFMFLLQKISTKNGEIDLNKQLEESNGVYEEWVKFN